MITKEEWAARRDEILAGGGVKGSGDVKSKKGLDADA
jgi:hypothetical protein